MSGVRCVSAPVVVDGPAGPWSGVREAMVAGGNASICTPVDAWSPSPRNAQGLRRLLGRDWPRYQRTADPVLRLRFAASRVALKSTAAAVLRTDPEALDLSYTLGGKPYLRGLGHLDVSLAHAGDLIAVGVSAIGRIGVDLEPTRRRVPAELLMDHICTVAEKRELVRLPRARRAAAVLRLWTLKEAYTKALGQGLRLGFTEFGFGPGDGLRTPDGAVAAAGDWGFGTFPVREGWLLSVACEDAGLLATALKERW